MSKKTETLKMSSQLIWISNAKEGFILGTITDLGPDSLTVSTSDKYGKTQSLTVPYDSVYPAEDNSGINYDDNCSLMYLNQATLLNNVKQRFLCLKIYVSFFLV